MKIARQILLAAVTLSLLLFLFGCGENGPAGTSDGAGENETADRNAEFGGYEMSDEAPAFGDAELGKTADDGVEADDPVASDPEVIDLGARATTDVYVVRLAWGMLEGDSANTVETDWSGTISADRGALVVERLVLFEPGDRIVRPRPDRKVVDLLSKTGPHWDGLVLTLLDPVDDSTVTVENALRISLGSFEQTFTVPELSELDEVYDADAIGNQFAITAFRLEDLPCARGFLSGVWGRTGENRGVFRGRWTSYLGLARGFVRGDWRVNEENRRVFFGKYIGVDGAFRGLLRGTWGDSPDGRAAGWFRGAWHGREEIKGLVHGVWRHAWRGPNEEAAGETAARRHGFFHGRWFQACDPSEIADEFDSEL